MNVFSYVCKDESNKKLEQSFGALKLCFVFPNKWKPMYHFIVNTSKNKSNSPFCRIGLKIKQSLLLLMWSIFQPIVTDCHFNNARWNLPIWMAIHTIYTDTRARHAGIMLHFFANFIPKPIGQLLYGDLNKQQLYLTFAKFDIHLIFLLLLLSSSSFGN